MFLRFIGKKSYHGFDGAMEISANENQIAEMSDDKAKQLIADFPKDWEKISDEDAEKELDSILASHKKSSDEANADVQKEEQAKADAKEEKLAKKRGRPKGKKEDKE